MTYQELIKKFWQFNSINALGAPAVAIYLLLLETWHEKEFAYFSISDAVISKELKLSRGTIIKHKMILKDLGLIQIQKCNGLASIYCINNNYPINKGIDNNLKKIKIEDDSIQKQQAQKPKNSIHHVEPITFNPKLNSNKPKNIPSMEEFLAYAKTIEIYDESLEFQVKTKYESWVSNGWRNGYDKNIRDWKISLKNTMVYMRNPPSENIIPPTIKRPKQTYNE